MQLSILNVHQAVPFPVRGTTKVANSVNVNDPRWKGVAMEYDGKTVAITDDTGQKVLVFPTNIAYAVPKDLNAQQAETVSQGNKAKAEGKGKTA